MLAGIHRAAAEAPGLCVSWQPGSRPPWEALFEAAGKSSLEQSWAYGEAVAAQHGQIVERHVLVAEGEPLALLQAFRRRYWKVGVTRILRGPLWLIDPLSDPRAGGICRSIAARYRRRLDFLSWLPELPDDARSAALVESQGLRRVATGYASAWLDLRSEEHTSELQSLMRISYAVFCLKKTKKQ